jgi:hypothetical protein
MAKYKIVRDFYVRKLEEKVAEHVKKGWMPIGGIATVDSEPTEYMETGIGQAPFNGRPREFYQAMILQQK